jgi:hypothetical protein
MVKSPAAVPAARTWFGSMTMLGLSVTGPVLSQAQLLHAVYCASSPRCFMRAVTSTVVGGISVALRRSPSLVLTAVTVRLLWTGPLSLARLVLTVASCVPAASDADSVAEVAL